MTPGADFRLGSVVGVASLGQQLGVQASVPWPSYGCLGQSQNPLEIALVWQRLEISLQMLRCGDLFFQSVVG